MAIIPTRILCRFQLSSLSVQFQYLHTKSQQTDLKMGSTAIEIQLTDSSNEDRIPQFGIKPLQNALHVGLVQTKPTGVILPGTEQPEILPKLFTPMTIRGLTLQNRIMVSPMCMYSSATQDGVFSNFHLVHYGSLALRGAGLVIIEATSVSHEGRLSPEDTGLWNGEQMESLKTVVDFTHATGSKIGIQLAHGGRKAGAYPPFHNFEERQGQLGRGLVPETEGGFPNALVAPSPIPWNAKFPAPHELSTDEIKSIICKWVQSAKYAVEAGVDMIEIHAAHGYLIHEFLSGNTNKRTDEYGGTLQNRLRLVLEIIAAIRKVIPEFMPLFLRVSGTDFFTSDDILAEDPRGWDIFQVIELCKQIVPLGIDLIDISSGANIPGLKGAILDGYGFHVPLAEAVKAAKIDGLLIGTPGSLGQGIKTEQLLQEGKLDAVLVGREFLGDPNLVYTMASELGLKVRRALQYSWMWPDFQKNTK